MMDEYENNSEDKQLVTRQHQELSTLNHEVEELRAEVKQLREDIELIDIFQKKPMISVEVISTVGFFIVAALVVIGIFF